MRSFFQEVLRSLPENLQAAFLAQLLFPSLAPPKSGKESWTPHGSSAVFFWSQAKSAEQLTSEIIFPTQYSDVTALIKNERASPQNAKLKKKK